MTDDRMALMEALQKADDGNFLRTLTETVLQILMDADVEGLVGADRYERTGERTTWRNGYRDRTLDTRLGQLNLKISQRGLLEMVNHLFTWGDTVTIEAPDALKELMRDRLALATRHHGA